MPVTNALSISVYLHCALCLESLPPGRSPRSWASLEAGWTVAGLQLWCKRHEVNVLHVDFEGKQHPANTSRPAEKSRDSRGRLHR
jgi:hypothetical protein